MTECAPHVSSTDRGSEPTIELSIIVIGRNEESRIERCLRSVFAALEGVNNYEVIYVDSASEDQTVEVAKQFPIRIVQLRPDWSLSPSAGRYIGFQQATGQLLMFVDGDTVLYKRWIKHARHFLLADKTRGGVAGVLHALILSPQGSCVAVDKDRFGQAGPVEAAAAVSLGGIAMYRREAMQVAGTFNPYLKAGEEGEVALRIRQAGYTLMRVNRPMCLTYAPSRESCQEMFRRSAAGLFDFGPSLRYCLSNKLALSYLREELWFVGTFLGSLVLLTVTIAATLVFQKTWLLAVAVAATTGYLLWRKTPKLVLVSLLKRTLITYRTCISLITSKRLPVESYPTDVVVIK